MPKIARERTEENQRRIEAAALALFTRQGFHGTNSREIAKKAGVSSGAIYTYFPNKEAIFSSLAQRYRLPMDEWLRQTVASLREPLSRPALAKLASSILRKTNDDPEFLLLLLSDVIEFKNQHFLETFHDIPRQLQSILGPCLDRMKKQPGWRGEEPAFVLASVCLYFFTYALIEKHMHGEQHLGLSHEKAIDRFVELVSGGLWAGTKTPRRKPQESARDRDARLRVLYQGVRDRVDYIRFLSGRLWSSPPDVPPGPSESKTGGHLTSMLFFPEIPRDPIDVQQLRIEAAALQLFTRQGFHGANMRDIAEEAGVSPGAIYAYYASKEAIFETLVRNYRHCMRKFLERVFKALEDPFSRAGLRLFAVAIRSSVYNDAEYWLLMYIDVIEFKGRHFGNLFHNVPEQFRRLLGPAVDAVKKRPDWCGQDPALAMAMIYLHLVTYFVIERLMHGNQHLGVSDEEAVERFINFFSVGFWDSPAQAPSRKPPSRRRPSSRTI
ncbi:MAG TPA: TetR/AcrR family transcriptional regulator [Candidatus Saccharimonadales bacterium]|nr:TetR/AcrR family transcriptional regulator [Candidatus Saccharimonadales bacterium]